MVVVLLGYMGSGKSKVGALLAKKLNFNFLDLDNCIEKEENATIASIFNTKGEIYFRKKEAQVLRSITASNQNLVLSLGGGTPCYSDNMKFLIENDQLITIYLSASLVTLVERLKKETQLRPLIAHLNTDTELNEFVGKHLFERTLFYNQAKQTIYTDGKTIAQVVEELNHLLA